MALRMVQRLLGSGSELEAEDPEDLEEMAYDDARPLHQEATSNVPMAGYLSAYLYRAEPRTFEDAGSIADCMKGGHPVVVNMEQADDAEGQRIRDFLRGAAYALGGDVRKVASKVYACVPAVVQIQRLLCEHDAAEPREDGRLSGMTAAGEQDVWPE